MANVKFSGGDDLARRLLLLEENVREFVAVEAVQKVNQALVAKLKSVAPSDTGTLVRSITAKAAIYQHGNVAVGIVGPDSGHEEYFINGWNKKVKKKPMKYAHLVDLGTQGRKTNWGANRGAVTPQGFMDQVRIGYFDEAVSIFRNAVNEAVNASVSTAGS